MINRIIDVNLNRSAEALRIIEDVARFALNNKSLTLKLKNFRHQAAAHFKSYNLISFRDVIKDSGKFLNTHSEFEREGLSDVIRSNCKRLQESSRVLEELLKLSDKKAALLFKNIRFFIYGLEKELVIALKKKFELSLCVIIDTEFIRMKDMEKIVKDVISGGASLIQLRADNLNTRSFIDLAKKLKKITKKAGLPLIIYDRVDIAIASDADGIHAGKEGIPREMIRTKFFYNKIFGFSASTDKEIKDGKKYNADYIGLEPVSVEKPAEHNKNLLLLKRLYHKYNKEIPCVIMSGIRPDSVPSWVRAGVKHFGLTSAALTPENSKKITAYFKAIITGKKKSQEKSK